MDKQNITAMAEKYCESQFSVDGDNGKTHFRITKLMPFDGFRVLDSIRAAIGERLATVNADASVMTIIISVAASIPPNKMEEVMRPLFASVTYTNAHAKTPAPVCDGNAIDQTAFAGLEPITVYNLLLRCLAVNFFSSFAGIKSLLDDIIPDSNPQPTPTSTPSSQHHSTQG